MSFQPDMIWQFAQFIKEKYSTKNMDDCSIYVVSKVSLNGRTFTNIY
ncbi:HTTM domain-containing protein [Urechidicola croceus]